MRLQSNKAISKPSLKPSRIPLTKNQAAKLLQQLQPFILWHRLGICDRIAHSCEQIPNTGSLPKAAWQDPQTQIERARDIAQHLSSQLTRLFHFRSYSPPKPPTATNNPCIFTSTSPSAIAFARIARFINTPLAKHPSAHSSMRSGWKPGDEVRPSGISRCTPSIWGAEPPRCSPRPT